MRSGVLYGRESLVQQAGAALAGPGSLVTLTGIAGAGTTSVALAVAAALDPSGASALVAGRPAVEPGQLGTELGGVTGPLVIIDDADHPPDARETVDDLRRRRPALRILLTSHSPLGLDDEVVIRVPPLPTPEISGPAAGLADEPAVRMFIEVATKSGADPLQEVALEDVARICQRLGGLPKAIELVAARAPAFTPSTLLELLNRGQSTLLRTHGGSAEHELPEAIAWSIGLLSDEHRALLRDLTAFHSPVALDALEQVCPGGALLDGLTALIEAHLLQTHTFGSAHLYAVHPLVRDHLTLAGATPDPAVLHRHQEWSADIAREALDLERHGRFVLARTLTRRHEPDLTRALDTALERADREDAADIGAALAALWFNRGVTPHNLQTLTAVVHRWPVEEFTEHRHLRLTAWATLLAIESADSSAQADLITPMFEKLVTEARADDEALLLVLYLGVQGARIMLDRTAAAEWAREGREVAERLGAQAHLAKLEAWSGMIAHQGGRPEEASELAQRALARAEQLPDRSVMLSAAGLLATLPTAGPTAGATAGVQPLVERARELGDLRLLDWLEPVAAVAALAEGHPDEGRSRLTETLRRARTSRSRGRAAVPLLGLFFVALHSGDTTWAGRILGMLTTHLPALRASLPPATQVRFDAAVSTYRSAVPPSQSAADEEWGARLGWDEALRAALDYSSRPAAAPPTTESQPTGLTAREEEILDQLTHGATNREIAAALHISPKTVMHHTSSIYRKLSVHTRAQAVAWRLRQLGR